MGAGDGRVHEYCRAQGIPILLEIPEDRRIAEADFRGAIVVEALPEYREHGARRRGCILALSAAGRR
jgi:MinD superfamily P-loop ATPase